MPQCQECFDTGRVAVMRSVGGRSHRFVQPCAYCPPNAERRANRGGRGWQGPHTIVVSPEEMLRRQLDAQAQQERWLREQAGIIDMIEVAGVWMTPEDARAL